MTMCPQCQDAADRELRSARAAIDILNQQIERLQGQHAAIVSAMRDGRMGDVRRLVMTGSDKPVIPITGVIARNGAR